MIKSYFSYLYKNIILDCRKYMPTLFEHNPKAKLLDCGCWDGKNTIKYGNLVGTKNLYGVEIHGKSLIEAKKKGIKAKLGNLNEKLPFPDNTFDVAVAYHVIEHLVNVRSFVSEIHRVLKKGGYVIIGTPNLASWHNIFALLIGMQPFSGPTIYPNYESGIPMVRKLNLKRNKEVFSDYKAQSLEHIKIMTTKTLVGLFEKHKFKIENIKGFGYYPMPHLISRFFSKLDSSHSHYIILKARK